MMERSRRSTSTPSPSLRSNRACKQTDSKSGCGQLKRTGLVILLMPTPRDYVRYRGRGAPALDLSLAGATCFFVLLGQAVSLKLKDPSYTELTNS